MTSKPPGVLGTLAPMVVPSDAASRLLRRMTSKNGIGVDDVTCQTIHVFKLPEHLLGKADPGLIGADEQHFAAVVESVEWQIADLSDRLGDLRKAPGGAGRAAMDRDLEIHRVTANLRMLRRYGPDICLGRMVRTDSPDPVSVGRLGLTGSAG